MSKDNYDFISAEDVATGFEDIDLSTMAIPFIKLAQDLSPQLKSSKPEYVEGLKVGDAFNSVTGLIYGKDFDFTTIKFERIFTEWKPDRGGFVGYHTVAEAMSIATTNKFNQMQTSSGNDLIETYMYYILIAGHEKEGVAIMSITSTNIKNAKKMNSVSNMQYFANGKKALPYHQVYTASSKLISNDRIEWYVFDFSFKVIVDETMYLAAKEQRELISDKTVDYAQLENKSQEITKVAY